MNSYLFLFSIAPVQSFISQARKTRDLYAGSKIISDLIDKAMELPKGSEYILPDKTLGSKPNRFIAIVKVNKDEEVKELGKKIEDKVQVEFRKFAEDIIVKLNKDKKPNHFDEQIKNHLQIHWVALPYDENNYKENFKEIESTLGAIKNVRMFEQMEEVGRKCSLCGERNALFYGGIKKPPYIQSDAINLNSLNQGEGLCTICFTKRYYEIEPFPSTAKVALMDTINEIEEDKNTKTKIEEFRKLFDDFEDQLYYEDNLTNKYFDKQNIKNVVPKKALDKLIELKRIDKIKHLKFSKYYAIIMFDGDSMGKWLSGSNCKDEKQLLEFHTELSKKLGEFAEKAKLVVVEPKGKIVYAGGEDFLGFVNLNHLFEVLQSLREQFENIVNQGIKEFKKDNDNLSFSAGIVVAHYKMPLSEVLKWARQAERDAKNINDDKNAFDIAVLKGSGEINKVQFNWGDEKELTKNIDIIGYVTGKLRNDEYSNTFIKSLDKEFARLINEDGKLENGLLIKCEISRLVKNSCMIQKNEGEKTEDYKKRKKAEIKSFSETLYNLYENSKTTTNFLSALNIAEFISRHLNKEATIEN